MLVYMGDAVPDTDTEIQLILGYITLLLLKVMYYCYLHHCSLILPHGQSLYATSFVSF